MQPALVDAAHAARRHGDAHRRADHERVEHLALLGVVHLRVVEARERAHLARRQPLVVEQHRGGDERPGKAATPGLVGAGHEPVPQLPVEPEQARRLRRLRAAAAYRRPVS